MRIQPLLALLAFVFVFFSLPATADSNAPAPRASIGAMLEATTPQACLANVKGAHVAQLNCCTDHKGLCGCRAGKIVCCDGTISKEPGCTCHGDEGVTE